MRCSKAHELISDALDSRLDEGRGLELSGHLADCPDCRRHQEVLQQGQALLREDLVEPPDNFEWKVQLKIQQALREQVADPDPVTGWRFWRPALASAGGVALVVLMAGGFLLGRVAPVPESSLQASVPVEPAGQLVSVEETGEAAPDLSGAVRGQPLRVNAASGGFGIRTVADEGFVNQSPYADPARGTSRWLQERDGQSLEVRRVVTPDGRVHYLMYKRMHPGGGNLNLELHRFRLQGPGGAIQRLDEPGS